MSVRKNLALIPGTIIQITDSTFNVGVVGWYVIDSKSELVAADGHTATFTCPDLLKELSWAMVPGITNIPNEDVAAILARILLFVANSGELPWTSTCTLSGFGGVAFTSPPQSVQAAIDKLSQERFGYYRLGANPDGSPGRVVEFSLFGADTAIRLVCPPPVPGQMNRATIRPILTLDPKTDSTALVNCLVPLGAGSGDTQFTLADALRTLSPTWSAAGIGGVAWQVASGFTFPGYRTTYPIYRRPNGNGQGDGYQYFLADSASITRYRQRWGTMAKGDIGPGTSTAADFAAAGQALYQTAVAQIRWTLNPTTVLTVTTLGKGDLRGIAGNTVAVEYPEYVTERSRRT